MCLCNLSQTQSITWRTNQNSRTNILDSAQTLQRIQATTSDRQCSQASGPLVGRPTSDRRSKLISQIDDIMTCCPRTLVDHLPTVRPPLPTLLFLKNL